MRLLAEKPAAMIGLREVARTAGVSHNAPYHHFSDRRGLLKVLAERSMAELLTAVRAEVGQAGDPGEVLRRGGAGYIRFATERPNAFEVIYDPTVCVPGDPTETMAPLIAELERLLTEAASGAGLEPEAGAISVWGLMHGLATLAAAGHITSQQAQSGCAQTLTGMLPR